LDCTKSCIVPLLPNAAPTVNGPATIQLRAGASQDQSQKIANVLEDYTQYYQSLQDQLDDVRATGRTQILQILNPAKGQVREDHERSGPSARNSTIEVDWRNKIGAIDRIVGV